VTLPPHPRSAPTGGGCVRTARSPVLAFGLAASERWGPGRAPVPGVICDLVRCDNTLTKYLFFEWAEGLYCDTIKGSICK